MFKNCCGCKTPTEKKQTGEKEKDAEVYSKSFTKSDGGAKSVSPPNAASKQESTVAVGHDTSAPKNPPAEQEVAKSPVGHNVPPPPPAPPAAARPPRFLEPAPDTEQPSPKPTAAFSDEHPPSDTNKCNDEEPVTKESTPSKSGSVAATTATAASTAPSGAEDLSGDADPDASKPPSPEADACDSTDTATLRAFAHGMLATPHPSKRSGSVPGLGSLPQWLSQEDDDDDVFREGGGTTEPPATPVGRDELALRRHRFFSDLLQAHQAATEHRVRFDPLGPIVAGGFEHEQRTPTVEFETLLNRLEKVTTRLEQTVSATEEALLKQAGLKSPNEQIVVDKGELSLKQIEPKDNTSDSKSSDNIKPSEEKAVVLQDPPKSSREKPCVSPSKTVSNMSVAAFQDILNGPLASFLSSSVQIGGDVAKIAQHVKQAFQAQVQYLSLAAQSGSPSMDQNMKLLEPTSVQIKAIQDFREKNRGSPHFNHLSAVSESIAALGWVTVSPAPAPYVKEMNDAGQFYTNRVLKEWKEKDKTHKTWVDSWVETLSELQKFVKQHHTTGLVWAGKGSVSVGGVPPPPPPGLPPPPPEMPIGDMPPGSDAQDRSALFAEINKGEGITSTLKKVTPDMQTHKNPTLRSGPAPFKAPVHTNTYRSVTAPGQAVDKPPTFIKEGKKWLIEYQKGNPSLRVDQTEMNNVIYMYKCVDSTLTVKGKVNSVVLDSCRKSSVVFDSVVSSVEFVNCQSVQMQVINKVPTISIDKTDGCQMYLSPESLEVEIVSAKSSEMNVMVPKPNGDYSEYPVPEQFKTTLSPKGLLTVAVESKG